MMKIVRMNQVMFSAAVLSTANAALSLDDKQDVWVSMGEKSKTLEAFAKQFLQLESIIKMYGKLVHNNVNTIRDVGMEMNKMDVEIRNIWSIGKGE